MVKKYVRGVALALLGLVIWIPAVPAEEAVPVSDAVTDVQEETALEHGKINTPDASPVDPGHLEVEFSFAYTHSKRYWDNDGDVQPRGRMREQAAGLAVTAGVVEDFDVTVGGSYLWLQDQENDFNANDEEFGPESGHNLGDLDISGRYRFFKSKENNLELAYIGGCTVPMGSSSSRTEMGTSQEFWSFNQTLVVSKDWKLWTANVDVGYSLPFGDKTDNARGTFNADAAVGYQVLPWLQPEMELNYSHDFIAGEDDQEVIAVTVGLVMPVNDRLRVNAGVQQGLWGRNADKATSLYTAVKLAF